MVNSGSLSSEGDRNVTKASFIQANNTSSINPQSPSPITASGAIQARNNTSTTDGSYLPTEVRAIEPTPTKTDFGLGSTNLASFFGGKPNSLSKLREKDSGSGQHKTGLFCSLPLDRVKAILTTFQQNNKLLFTSGIIGKIDTAPTELASSGGIKAKSPRKILCLYCERTFANSNLRQKHVERCHSTKQFRRVSSRRNQSIPCVFNNCDKLTTTTEHTLKELFEHLVLNHSNKYYGCLSCEERFLNASHLDDHNASTHRVFPEIERESRRDEEVVVPTRVVEAQIETPSTPPQQKVTRSQLRTRTGNSSAIEIATMKSGRRRKKDTTTVQGYQPANSADKGLNKTKKLLVKSSRIVLKRSTRLQAKLLESQKKKRQQKKKKQQAIKKAGKSSHVAIGAKLTDKSAKNSGTSSASSSSVVNPYPEFDSLFRVKKITDHSIDNLKISSLTFDDVFDKAFFNRIKCNIQENLLHHIDGKLFENEESENRISNFEKISNTPQEVQQTTENYGCELTLNAVTPAPSALLTSSSAQFGEDLESQIEYGSKPSQTKKRAQQQTRSTGAGTGSEEAIVHYKYFTRRKYQASILEHKENRDLSKLDMWTQYVVKTRQQRMLDEQKSAKELSDYRGGDEYVSRMRREELNRILDRRGPFEDLQEEASKKAVLDKLWGSERAPPGDYVVSEQDFSEVRQLIDDLLNRVVEICENVPQPSSSRTLLEHQPFVVLSPLSAADRYHDPAAAEIPSYLNLRRTCTSTCDEEIDRSDKIALICSSQETENFELPTNKIRDKNEKVELTGEWARSRIFVCAACGLKFQNCKQLMEHKNVHHQNVWVQHYELVGNQSELYRHLSIPGLGKVGLLEDTVQCRQWKRSDARKCSKCEKQCNSLGELHRHILECGGDWTWMLARKKYKYRPFGAKSRRKRRGLVKRRIFTQKTQPTEKKIYKKTFDGPRPKPSDADTIQRMLANLPPKRATRKIMCLKDGLSRPRNKPQQQNQSPKVQNKMKCGKIIHRIVNEKTSTSEPSSSSSPKAASSSSKNSKNNARNGYRKSLRNLNKVLASRILDTNSTLLLKRKLKRNATAPPTTPKHVEEAIEDVISENAVEQETDDKAKSPPKKKTPTKTVNKTTEDDVSTSPSTDAEKEIAKSKRTSPRIDNKNKDSSGIPPAQSQPAVTKTVAEKMNIKRFFSVKKKNNSSQNVSSNEEGRKQTTKRKLLDSKRTAISLPENLEQIAVENESKSADKKCGKKRETFSNLVRTLSLRTKKHNTETVMMAKVSTNKPVEEVIANSKKRKLKNGIQKVVKQIKKIVSTEPQQTTSNNEQPADDKCLTSSSIAHKDIESVDNISQPGDFLDKDPVSERSEKVQEAASEPERIAIPAAAALYPDQSNANVADPSIPTSMVVSCSTNENSTIPGTILDVQNRNEQISQPKNAMNVDNDTIAISLTAPSVSVSKEPESKTVQTARTTTNPPAIQKGRMRTKKLNDCIAMLTDKLNKSLENIAAPNTSLNLVMETQNRPFDCDSTKTVDSESCGALNLVVDKNKNQSLDLSGTVETENRPESYILKVPLINNYFTQKKTDPKLDFPVDLQIRRTVDGVRKPENNRAFEQLVQCKFANDDRIINNPMQSRSFICDNKIAPFEKVVYDKPFGLQPAHSSSNVQTQANCYTERNLAFSEQVGLAGAIGTCPMSHDNERHANESTELNFDNHAQNPVAIVEAENLKSKKTTKPKRRSRSTKTVRKISLSDSTPECTPEQDQNVATVSMPTDKQNDQTVVSMAADIKQSGPAIVTIESDNQQNNEPLDISLATADEQKDASSITLKTSEVTSDITCQMQNSEKHTNESMTHDNEKHTKDSMDVCAENKFATAVVVNQKSKKASKPKRRSRSAKTKQDITLSDSTPEFVPAQEKNEAIIPTPTGNEQTELAIVSMESGNQQNDAPLVSSIETTDKPKDANTNSLETSKTMDLSCQMIDHSEKASNEGMEKDSDIRAENQVATALADNKKPKKTRKPKGRSLSAKTIREIPLSDTIPEFVPEQDLIISLPISSKQGEPAIVSLETTGTETGRNTVLLVTNETTDTSCQLAPSDEKHANDCTEVSLNKCATNQVATVPTDNRRSKKTSKPKRRSRSAKTVREIPSSDSVSEFVVEQGQNAAKISIPTISKQKSMAIVAMEIDNKQSQPALVSMESGNQQNDTPLIVPSQTTDKQMDENALFSETSCKQNPAVVDTQNVLETNIDDALKLIEIAVGSTATEILSQNNASKKVNLVYSGMQEEPHILEKNYLIPNKSVENKEKQSDSEDEVPLSALVKSKEIENGNTVEDSVISETVTCTLTNKSDKSVEISDIGAKIDDSAIPQTNDGPNDNNKTDVDTCIANDGQHIEKDRANKKQKRRSRSRKKSLNGKIPHLTVSDILENVSIASNLDESIQPETKEIVSEKSSTIIGEPLDHNESVPTYDEINSGEQSENVTISANTTVEEVANRSQEISQIVPQGAVKKTTVITIAKARRNRRKPSGFVTKRRKPKIQVSTKTIEQVAEVLLNETETTLATSGNEQTADENQDVNAPKQDVQAGLEISSTPDKQETAERTSTPKLPELLDQNEVAEILHPVTKNGEIKGNDSTEDAIGVTAEESNVRRRSNRTAKSKALESILDDALAELTESERNREIFKSVLVSDNIVVKSTKKKKRSLERKKSNSKDRENSSNFDLIRENLCKVLLKEKRREVFNSVDEDEYDDLGTNDSTQGSSQIEENKEATSVPIAVDLPPSVRKAALTSCDLVLPAPEADSTHANITSESRKESAQDEISSVDTVLTTENVSCADMEPITTPVEQNTTTFDRLDTAIPTDSGSVLPLAEPATLDCPVSSSNVPLIIETSTTLQMENPVSESAPSRKELYCSVVPKVVDTELAQPEVEQDPSEISNADTTELVNDAGKELRRSRRSSRKITSYNENELMNDPVLDDLPKPTARGQRERSSKKVATNGNEPESSKSSVGDLERTAIFTSSSTQKDTDWKTSDEVLSELVPNTEHTSVTTLVENDDVCEKFTPCNESTAVPELDVSENSNASAKVLEDSVSGIVRTDLLTDLVLDEPATNLTQDIPEESVFLSPVRKKARRAPRRSRNSRRGSKKRVPVTLEYSQKQSQKETQNSTPQATDQTKSEEHLKKLTSDELFDLLKTNSADDNNDVESTQVANNNAFLQNFDEISSDSRDDNFDILGESLVDDEDDVEENSSDKSFAPLEAAETEINSSFQNDRSVEETEPDPTNTDLSRESLDRTAQIDEFVEDDEVTTKMRPLKRSRSFNNRQKKTQEALLGEEIENQLADISSAVSNFDNTIADKAPDGAPEPVPSESSAEQVQPPVLLLSNKNNKKSNKREYKPGYCEICNKSFQRPDSLVKHKRTISHISKLSEIEAREAEQLKSQTADAEPSNDHSRQQSMDAAEITSMDSSSKTLEPPTHDPVETTKTPEPLPPPLQPQNEDSRSSDVVEITSDASVNKNDINLFDMLQHSNRADANRSPFSLRMDNAGLKLAHIIVGTSLINDVLNKPTAPSKDSILPANPEPTHMFSQQQSPPEFRRYKSLGERKSFEAENPSPPHQIPASANESNLPAAVPQPAMDYFEPQLSQTAGTILEKQISLLQNIIENRSGVKYIDDISISSGGPSINNDNDDNCSDMSLEEDIPKSDDCCRIFTSTEQVLTNVNTLKSVAVVTVPLNEEDRGFLKPPPTQYEEISEDSSNLRNYDDQKSRKVLNRDEELFLECCSLLKSGSEVSSYSKKSQTLSKVLNNLDLKPSEEPSWLENKALPRHAKDYVSIEDYSDDDGSRIPTPLGDNFVDDQSNSNTISSNWDTSKLNNADDVIVVHDKEDENSRPAEQEVGAAAAADLTSLESRSFVFDKDRLRDDSEENLGGLDCVVKEDGIQENADEDDDVFDDDPPEFGPQHFAEGGIIIRTKSVSEESSISSHHEAEADATNRKKSEDLSDASTTDSRKMLTKGAMKVFEGLKVSIPTEDLNMAEVLNGSGILKPNNTAVEVQEKRKSLTPEPVVATTAPTVSTAGTPKKLIKHKFSRGKLELGSKFLFKIKRKPTARAFRRKKQTGSNKMTSRTHDIYDFEETQDNSDVFTKPDFRSFRCSKKSNDAKKTEDSHNLVDSDNDSQDGAGGNNSAGFEAASSSASSVSDIPSKKPRTAQQTSTKKKCMIMGRIFKNAIKSRVEDEIRDIPVIDHTELVENFVMSCPDSLTNQNTVASKKPTVMTEEEMNSAFDKLVNSSEVVATEDKNPCELMKKPATPTFTKPQNNHKTVLSSARKRTTKIKPRKRARANSDSTDDEFSLTSKKRNYRKNSKTEDNSINLEQELRECMGVASRKSQRKCTSGKQNVLVEYWSSDESNFEAMLESQILPQPANSAAKKHDNNGDLGAATPVTQAPALNNGETSTVDRANDRKQPEEQKLAEKEQPTTTTSQSSEDHVRKPAENRRRKPTKVRRLKSPTTSAVSIAEDSQPASNKKELATTTTATGDRSSSPATASPTSMLNRRKRAAPNPLYHWSSSSEDESCDLIEIKPIRDELEDDEDRPIQHGWIVGDSPKKLVTMLAQAKGKKCDGEGVKEQGGKKRNSSSGGGNHNAFS